ncbi:hypothetical protein [Chondromyces apiculatus]|uniref:Lipoprotein n=1 Tax=Chondromyces apiculatus DSM 436 TaxID=1192034 RepID=A0A017SWV3_9BACT|nr:hypothetical protein [Chondromyces apiculatus]EYF01045.1 Hypothetical protein CAP_8758 [Chondromyces apiculatus DSM 436]
MLDHRARRAVASSLTVLALCGCAAHGERAEVPPCLPAAPGPASASAASAAASVTSGPSDAFLLTIFLRHDQTKTLDQINEHLDRSGYRQSFPPEGTEVVSWYVMMGVGQVVTLRVPPDKLRTVNVAIERGAWGAFRTEFYPTYDYVPIWKAQRAAAGR